MNVEIIKPYGFCFGVKRTINLTKDLKLKNPEKNIVLLGYPIHNEEVINDLLDSKIKIVNGEYDDMIDYLRCFGNNDSIYVLSAHGHANDIIEVLNELNLSYLDTTCPYIKTIHERLEKINSNEHVLYIGNINHIECITSLRHIHSQNIEVKKYLTYQDFICDYNLTIVNQSTYYIDDTLDDLKNLIVDKKNVTIVNNFCKSIELRFEEIKNKADEFDCFIIIGSKTSSNAKSIEKFCNSLHKRSLFIEKYTDILDKNEYLSDFSKKIGIVTATSAPDYLAEAIYNALDDYNDSK